MELVVNGKSLDDVLQTCSLLSEQERLQLAFELTRGYDGNALTALAEEYAVTKFGMERAEQGQEGYDGTLPNKRTLQVKSKKFGAHRDSGTYVTLSQKTLERADDLLIIFVDYETGKVKRTIGPVPIDRLTPKNKGRHFVNQIVRDHPDRDITL